MLDQPKTITVPGIPDQLREQTLAEFVLSIPDPNHLVRRELRELQRVYLDMPRLQAEIASLREQVALLSPKVTIPEVLPAASAPKMPCPHCGKLVSTLIGPWSSHMKTKHDATDVPIPAV